MTSGRVELVYDGNEGENSPFARSLIYELEHNEKGMLRFSELGIVVTSLVNRNADQTPSCNYLRNVNDMDGQFSFILKDFDVNQIADKPDGTGNKTATAEKTHKAESPLSLAIEKEVATKNYLNSLLNRYSYAKNFLYEMEQVPFLEVFFPIRTKYRNDIFLPNELFEKLDKGAHLYITGFAGSGKTTLMRFLLLKAANSKNKIPILFEFRHSYKNEVSFEETIFNYIQQELKLGTYEMEDLLENGGFLFLLDGLDEYNKEIHDLNHELERWSTKYPKNGIAVTSRPWQIKNLLEHFDRFEICILTMEDVKAFIEQQKISTEWKNNVFKLLANPKGFFPENFIHKYLTNPLLLSLLIQTQRKKELVVYEKPTDFYAHVYELLLESDTKTKQGYSRRKYKNLETRIARKVIEQWSFETVFNQKYAFNRYDFLDFTEKIRVDIKRDFNEDLIFDYLVMSSILIQDGFNYRFIHRNIQDYLACRHINKLSKKKKQKFYKDLDGQSVFTNSFVTRNFLKVCYEVDANDFEKYLSLRVLKGLYMDSAKVSECIFR